MKDNKVESAEFRMAIDRRITGEVGKIIDDFYARIEQQDIIIERLEERLNELSKKDPE